MRFVVAVGLDIVMVLVFALVGRSSHAEHLTPAAVLATAWPYLVAAVLGAVIARAWRNPYGWRTGIVVWVSTVVLGMLLRLVAGGTAAFTFWIVAFVSLGVLLLGWRLVARVIVRAAANRTTNRTTNRRSGRDAPTGPRTTSR